MFPLLNYYVLTDVIYALKDGDLSYGETLGFTLEEINEISQLPLDVLLNICHSPASFITVKIHHDILRKQLERARTETQHHQQINRAIRLG
ncbi:TPA: STY4526/YPO1902 family pathogenicity island replication protein, partial [Raoultella ornithinolytica]